MAKRLPRSPASAAIYARLLPFHWSALNYSSFEDPASKTGTPKQRQKASNKNAEAAAGQAQNVLVESVPKTERKGCSFSSGKAETEGVSADLW